MTVVVYMVIDQACANRSLFKRSHVHIVIVIVVHIVVDHTWVQVLSIMSATSSNVNLSFNLPGWPLPKLPCFLNDRVNA